MSIFITKSKVTPRIFTDVPGERIVESEIFRLMSESKCLNLGDEKTMNSVLSEFNFNMFNCIHF